MFSNMPPTTTIFFLFGLMLLFTIILKDYQQPINAASSLPLKCRFNKRKIQKAFYYLQILLLGKFDKI